MRTESPHRSIILAEELRSAGVIDTHYHIGPELLPRRYDVASLADAAKGWNAILVLKNHTFPTTPLASLARARFGARFYGGVVLNRFVGGLSSDAVMSAVSGNRADVTAVAQDTSPVVVWMPTVHAASHLRVFGYDFDPRWSGCCSGHSSSEHGAEPDLSAVKGGEPVTLFDEQMHPSPGLVPVLETIARQGCRLATGHLSSEEIMRLVPLALEIGVPGIVLTHPHYPSVQLADSQLKQLARRPEVFIEHCMAIHTIEGVPLERIAASIRATGPDQVLLSTDFGQVVSDPFPDGTINYATALETLLSPFLDLADILRMFCHNGRRALGLS